MKHEADRDSSPGLEIIEINSFKRSKRSSSSKAKTNKKNEVGSLSVERTKLAPIFDASSSSKLPGPPSSSAGKKRPVTSTPSEDEDEDLKDREVGSSSRKKAGNWSTSSLLKQAASNMTANQPLSDKVRPQTLADYIGHESVVGPDSILRTIITTGNSTTTLPSCILWGPPGCGKTTLARVIANTIQPPPHFVQLSATESGGLTELRKVFEKAKGDLKWTGRKTVVFMDELQRFTKAQQDAFLPPVETGLITLIGAMTENPSFKVNNALLSRCQVFVLDKLTDDNITSILRRALTVVRADTLPQPQMSSDVIDESLLTYITSIASGDSRVALNALEVSLNLTSKFPPGTHFGEGSEAREKLMRGLKSSLALRYDRTGDSHYDLISALHKSIRGSDPSAAVYYLAAMLTKGEDPLYIARRLVVVASEDVGLADNAAIGIATACFTACQQIGMPECRLNLAHCVVYLAEAPKSTRAYEAYKRAEAALDKYPNLDVPLQLRNAPTTLMRSLGYGKSYHYNPAFAHPVVNDYLPPELTSSSSAYQAARGERKHEDLFVQPQGSAVGKVWDEGLLREWEFKCNSGKDWEGREDMGK